MKTHGNQEFQDWRSRLTATLNAGTHECVICMDRVRRPQQTWNCDKCYAVLHLSCTSTWALTSLGDAEQISRRTNRHGPPLDGKTWRCPSCQYERQMPPTAYTCFCGKLQQPQDDKFVTAHSCGQTCGLPKGLLQLTVQEVQASSKIVCKHVCVDACHPGPCSVCEKMVQISCHCGKYGDSVRCGTYDSGGEGTDFSCNEVCGKLLACGKHTCARYCHSGECRQCDVMFTRHCYCQKSSKFIFCDEVKSTEVAVLPYACSKVCGTKFNECEHLCQDSCHSPEASQHMLCPYSPEMITKCPCGRTDIAKLDETPRTKCTDPIPACENLCGKTFKLNCQHAVKCIQKCHEGTCESTGKLMCDKEEMRSCRCGAEKQRIFCNGTLKSWTRQILCESKCFAHNSCGRHRCNAVCCPKLPESHECQNQCGKLFRCGKHHCKKSCHKGQCGPCDFVSPDGYMCPCRRTFVVRFIS